MSEAVLTIEDVGAVRILRMNRPDKLNALNFALTEALVQAIGDIDADEDVRAAILTGEGRAFSAGADRREFALLTPENNSLVEQRAELTTRLHAAIPSCRVPIVAAVNGYAMGGGAGLATACDYVIAADVARIAYPELSHGIVAAVVMTALVKDVGRKVAFDLVSTGRQVDAQEMMRLGLANRVVPLDALMPEALRAAELMAGFDARAMVETKRLLQRVADLSLSEGLQEGRKVNARMRAFRTPGGSA
jgi:enoyl-CoA hydratase/carnithine racemase